MARGKRGKIVHPGWTPSLSAAAAAATDILRAWRRRRSASLSASTPAASVAGDDNCQVSSLMATASWRRRRFDIGARTLARVRPWRQRLRAQHSGQRRSGRPLLGQPGGGLCFDASCMCSGRPLGATWRNKCTRYSSKQQTTACGGWARQKRLLGSSEAI